ncbi:MAG: hypothetical protein RIF32_10930, partial [Leptospirales bacterium]
YEGWLTWGFGLIYPLVIFAILMIFLVTDVFLRVVPDEPAILQEGQGSSLMIPDTRNSLVSADETLRVAGVAESR